MREVRAALWGVCGFGAVYLALRACALPTVTYDPVARTFSFTAELSGLSMRYYGDLLSACAAGVCAAALYLRTRSPPRPVGALTGAALSFVGLEIAYSLSRLLAAV
jgi:hypothetical protein